MGKIYDALKKVEREGTLKEHKTVVQKITSHAETQLPEPQPPAPGKKTTADKKETAKRGNDYEVPQKKVGRKVPSGNDYEVPRKKAGRKFSTGKLNKSLFVAHEPHSYLAEQFRSLRSRCFSLNGTKPLRTLLVTSTLPEEGKTTVAANLAVSIAQDFDEQVILIDADLRRPSLHEIFGLSQKDGLVAALNNKQMLQAALQKTDIEKLTVIPSGEPPENAAKLITAKNIQQLITDINSLYENHFIIFDSTPTLNTSEPAVLARQVDATLFVIHAGKTSRELVEKAVDTLGKDKILGVIFNHCNQPMKSYQNYYYYSKNPKE
jgi:protein-tyrosine kinase